MTPKPEGIQEDLIAFHRVISIACEELVDEAIGTANIMRRHHLESAVASFASIGVLLAAEKIVNETFGEDE